MRHFGIAGRDAAPKLPAGSISRPAESTSGDMEFAIVGWLIGCIALLCLLLGSLYLATSILVEL